MAVEGVGLPLGGLSAVGAGDVDEIGVLGERVSLSAWLDIAGEDDRQVLLRNRDGAAALAVDHRDWGPPKALADMEKSVAR